MIDEVELFFAREAPLMAWRLFRVRQLPDGRVLGAPMIHSPSPPPWLSSLGIAQCIEHDHRAPAAGCRCGIYGAVEGTLDSLPGYLNDTTHDRDPWAYAEIACSGRLFLDARGVRCEEAKLTQIALVEGSFATSDEWGAATEDLRGRYSVEMACTDAIPGWLHANVRARGAPTGIEGVDLAALARTLVAKSASL
jgi:hypothetical protein